MCHVCLQFQRALNFAAKVLHFFAVCWASTPNNYGEGVFLAPTARDVPGQTPLSPPLKGGEDPKSPFSGPPKISDFGVSFGRFRGSYICHIYHICHIAI